LGKISCQKPQKIFVPGNSCFLKKGVFAKPSYLAQGLERSRESPSGLTGKGLPSFTLADQRGRDRAVLALSQYGEATIILRDPAGKDRVALWLDQKSEGLALVDETGKPIAALSSQEKGKPSLSYFDKGQAYQIFK
jgi:hypothetical protein